MDLWSAWSFLISVIFLCILGVSSAPNQSCPEKCGKVNISYPFGIGEGCYLEEGFNMTCNNSDDTPSPRLLIRESSYKVTNISLVPPKVTIYMREIKCVPTVRTFMNPENSPFSDSVSLDWNLGFKCEYLKNNKSNYACVSKHSECYNNTKGGRYYCKCQQGYHGNPYLEHGCQDIYECENSPCKSLSDHWTCVNTPGSYYCESGGDISIALIAGLSGGILIILLTASSIFIYKRSQKIQNKRSRRNNLNQNSKQLEMKLMSSHGDTIERTKIFTLEEMQRATDNFNKTRIIGQGGHGTVYKGLLSDQRVTAIKSSKLMNQIEKGEFINEVALLSRIYHRNVVMLYGCCLETEVPLLAYEFVSNGTLSDHLHQLHATDPSYYLCWKDRLRIATQTSSAIAYLHSASSKTIFHGDLKSANILLDEKLNAKISDFGASKYVTSDQTHITATIVQGTMGYVDPEYFNSGKLTEKSDVYSLGAILVELFTGEKPISNARIQEQRNIIMHFLKLLNENKVEQILDIHLVKEAPKEEVEVFARLAGDCLNYKGEERPTMKEVVSTLEGMMRSKIKKKGSIIQEESKQPLQSFDISSPENSNWSTCAQQNTATQSSI